MNRRRRGLLALLAMALLCLSLGGRGPVRAQQAVNLAPGWNNVVYLGPDAPIAQALAPLGDELQEALHWDSGAQDWQTYTPSAPQSSSLATVHAGETYWLFVASASAFPQANVTPQPQQLASGWNNVAYLGPGAPTSDLLESSQLWAWDAARQRWIYRDPAAASLSDFQSLTPLQAYWVYVAQSPVTSIAPATAASTPAPSTACYAFQSLQPTVIAANDAITRAALGTLPVRPDLTPEPLRSGPDGSGAPQASYVPPTLLRAIAWIESGWHQAVWSTERGQSGPTLTSKTCAYGMLQILTDMHVNGTPTARQAAVGSDFQSNAAAAVQLLEGRWNRDPSDLPYLGRHDPKIVEDWYFVVWSYHCYGSDCESFGAHNNPDDPALPWPRPAYNSSAQLASQSSFDYSSYPYQELVWGVIANPPIVNGLPLWAPIVVQLPPHGSISYPNPHSVGEPSAHLDDGTSLPVLSLPPPSATSTPSATAGATTATPTATPMPLVPPSRPP